MKRSLSEMILIVCLLTVGAFGLFSMTEESEAHPKRLDYKQRVSCITLHSEES